MVTNVLVTVLIMLFYMAMGFTLCKTRLGSPAHAKTLSGLLIYILGPAMIINAFLNTEYSLYALKEIGLFFITTLIIQILFFFILYAFLRRKYSDAKYRIMTIGAFLGNVGFFGLPLINGVFPDSPIVSCYSCIYVMSMNVLVFTIGRYMITNDKKFVSIKGVFFNPTTIAIVISLPLFIFQVQFPSVISTNLSLLAKMVTPVCMIILGMRLSEASFKALFTRGFIYASCALKLIAFPIFAYTCVFFLPLSDTFKVSVFVLSAVPTGAIVQSMGELYECEQELTANVVLLTTLLCVITVPFLVWIVSLF